MRQEILSGPERRRRWSVDEKVRILAEAEVEGSRVADIARRHDITRQHIYQWRRELRGKGLLSLAPPVFLPVELASEIPWPDSRPSLPIRHSSPLLRRLNRQRNSALNNALML